MCVSEAFSPERIDPRLQTYECDEEGQGGNNGQCPAGLEHRASLVDVGGPRTVALAAVISEGSKVKVQAAGREARAVRVGNSAQSDDSSNECSYEAEVDECDEESIVAGS